MITVKVLAQTSPTQAVVITNHAHTITAAFAPIKQALQDHGWQLLRMTAKNF